MNVANPSATSAPAGFTASNGWGQYVIGTNYISNTPSGHTGWTCVLKSGGNHQTFYSTSFCLFTLRKYPVWVCQMQFDSIPRYVFRC